MDGFKEFQGKDFDAAIKDACAYFDATREKLEIEIIQDAKSGIFGIVGVRKAKIRARKVRLRETVESVLGSRYARGMDNAESEAPQQVSEGAQAPREGQTGRRGQRRRPGGSSARARGAEPEVETPSPAREAAQDERAPAQPQPATHPVGEATSATEQPARGRGRRGGRQSVQSGQQGEPPISIADACEKDVGRGRRSGGIRPERAERGEAQECGERPERGERDDRGGRAERLARPERGERPEKAEKAERGERGGRRDGRGRQPRGGRTERAERGEQQTQGKAAQAAPRSSAVEPVGVDAIADPVAMEMAPVGVVEAHEPMPDAQAERCPHVEQDMEEAGGPALSPEDRQKAQDCAVEVVRRLVTPILDDQEFGLEAAFEDGRVQVYVTGVENCGLLIGREGLTLASLQYLASRIVSHQLEASVRVQLEVGDYRQRQDDKLRDMALALAEKVRKAGRSYSTRPLSSYHRRIVHLCLRDMEDIQTRSTGEGAMKRVVVMRRRNS